MAKFKRNNLQLKTNQQIQLGDSQESLIKYDGSQLTLSNDGGELALDSTGVTVIGTVIADSYYGDGSPLTGVIADLVNDLSPQLGGDLDANGNVILLDNGTEAAPGLAFGSSTGTGLWYDYKIHISHNGDELVQMFYNSGQNISYIQTEALPSNQDTADLVLKTAATTGTGVAGDARLEGGSSSPGGTSGHARVVGGNSSTGQAGDVVLTPGTAGDPAGEDGAVNITQTEAPPVTTDRLYNLAGALTWNDIDLTNKDVVQDTSPQLGGDLYSNGFDIEIDSITPSLFINKTNEAVDEGRWEIRAGSAGFEMRTVKDLPSTTGTVFFRAIRLGNGAQMSHVEFPLQVQHEWGSANVPSYSFTTDADSGMYSGGLSILGFSTGNINRLTIEANGTLNVAGTSNYENLVTDDDDIPNKKYVDDNAGISEVLDDTSPQLGGDLDVNGKSIRSGPSGTNAYLSLVEGNDSLLVADGGVGEAAKNMHVRGGQSDVSSGGRVYITGGSGLVGGNVHISGGTGSASGSYGGDILITPGVSENDYGGSLHLSAPTGSTSSPILSLSEAHANGSADISLRAPVDVTTDRTWTLPQDDPSTATGKFLTTDAAGVLSFDSVSELYYGVDLKLATDATGVTVIGNLTTNDLTVDGNTIHLGNADLTEESDGLKVDKLTLENGSQVNEFSSDSGLGGDAASATKVPTQLAAKTYVDDNFKDRLKVISYTLPLAGVTDDQIPLAGSFRTVGTGITTDDATDWAVANQHVFILVNSITTGGQMIITGTSLSENTGVPVIGDTETIDIDTTAGQYYQTTKKWWEITNIDVTSGTITGIDYDYGVIGYPDLGNKDFKIIGYRLDAFAQNTNADFRLEIWKVEDHGSNIMHLHLLEDIGIDSGSGADQIIDGLRTGAFDRTYTPTVAQIWGNDTTITLKQLDFDNYFTNDENEIFSSERDEGYVIRVEGSPSGGVSNVDYITFLLYYKLLNISSSSSSSRSSSSSSSSESSSSESSSSSSSSSSSRSSSSSSSSRSSSSSSSSSSRSSSSSSSSSSRSSSSSSSSSSRSSSSSSSSKSSSSSSSSSSRSSSSSSSSSNPA